MNIVLQKFISDAGLSSRRQAETWIRQGKVTVNGRTAELGMRVNDRDEVMVYGKRVGAKPLQYTYIALNKPVGYTCTNRTFKNEKNIFNLVDVKQRLFVVGRLDKDSTGLVILTNNGQWAQKLSHPRYQHEKEYVVSLSNDKKLSVNQARSMVDILQKGVRLADKSLAKARQVKYLGNNTFNIILTQGKKRQLRRMFAGLGYEVSNLHRIRIGEVVLGDLPTGQWAYFQLNNK